MENIYNKLILSGILLLLIIVFGFFVSGRGKPYNPFIFGIHKLLSVGLFVFLAINIVRLNQVSPLSPITTGICVIFGVFFFITMVTGGVISVEKEMPKIFSSLHKLLPYASMIFFAVSFFFLWQKK